MRRAAISRSYYYIMKLAQDRGVLKMPFSGLMGGGDVKKVLRNLESGDFLLEIQPWKRYHGKEK